MIKVDFSWKQVINAVVATLYRYIEQREKGGEKILDSLKLTERDNPKCD